jgi:hypothetical protein
MPEIFFRYPLLYRLRHFLIEKAIWEWICFWLPQNSMPDISQFIHGKRILLVDGVFRGVRLHAPGTFELKYSYQPPYWQPSLMMPMLGILLLGPAWITSAKAPKQ